MSSRVRIPDVDRVIGDWIQPHQRTDLLDILVAIVTHCLVALNYVVEYLLMTSWI